MAQLQHTLHVDRAGLDRLREARTDLLVERADGADSWTIDRGPFRSYRRQLTVVDQGGTDPSAQYAVTERIDYRLALPIW